jgi:glucuronate isomerase
MQAFITDNFLLDTPLARELYHEHAAPEPIFDYHCHLPPDQIVANKQFRNLSEIWLAGDHYKWRAMRSDGVPEKYCTGDASDWEKFLAFARTVPHTLRNPLYHWTHIELKRFFGITKLLDESSAKEIWDEANEKLASMPVQRILETNRVVVVCTTDDPTDSLEHHRRLRESGTLRTRVYPTFRPDKALTVDQPVPWTTWVAKLGECPTLTAFLGELVKRLDFFHANGCRLSDHGLNYIYAEDCTETEAARVFDAARAGRAVARADADKFRSFMLLWLGEQYHARGWVMQFHLGAMRNNNTRMMRTLGPDTGFDSTGDWPQAEAVARYLDRLDQKDHLAKTILYNLNPADNYAFATMLGNFQDGSVPGKLQLGSGWWFLDQQEGMEWQINALSNLGLLSRFVGMITDSRSFLSYSRHEYFRRLLCHILGRDVADGKVPHDVSMLGELVRNVCYHNAKNYFGLEPGAL